MQIESANQQSSSMVKEFSLTVKYQSQQFLLPIPDADVTVLNLKFFISQEIKRLFSTLISFFDYELNYNQMILQDAQIISLTLKNYSIVEFRPIYKPLDYRNYKKGILIQGDPEINLIPKFGYEPAEAIIVLIDISGSMSMKYSGQMNRLGAACAFFSAFADKTIAFKLKNVVKLVCFDDKFEEMTQFIDNFDKFIDIVGNLQPRGGTQCFTAIEIAIMRLQSFKQAYPKTKLRIIALTDGEDNSPFEHLAEILINNSITMDSFVVGPNCSSLKSLTFACGGRCYYPETLESGLELFEIETILSTELREKSLLPSIEAINWNRISQLPFNSKPVDIVKTAGQADFSDREKVLQRLQDPICSDGISQHLKQRILKEYQQAQGYQKFLVILTSDLLIWKIILAGPANTPYEDGIFTLSCTFPKTYPMTAPIIVFENKIYHCNISRTGKICLDLLVNNWTQAETVVGALLEIINLLRNPNLENAVESVIASTFKMDPINYTRLASESVATYAKPQKDELINLIIRNKSANFTDHELSLLSDQITHWINSLGKQLL